MTRIKLLYHGNMIRVKKTDLKDLLLKKQCGKCSRCDRTPEMSPMHWAIHHKIYRETDPDYPYESLEPYVLDDFEYLCGTCHGKSIQNENRRTLTEIDVVGYINEIGVKKK